MQLVEQHCIKKSDPSFAAIDAAAFWDCLVGQQDRRQELVDVGPDGADQSHFEPHKPRFQELPL